MRFYLYFKNVADFILAIILAFFLLPLFVAVSLLVLWQMGPPIFFFQQRPGFRGKPFWLIKFRTMTNATSRDGMLLPDSERLTRLGSWLRSTSIDELPAVINVLCGELSFIGPRPLLMEYLPLYSHQQARRHDVKPGFSGWAQINGRNSLSWERKFEFDVYYVEHISLFLDLYIFFITLFMVLSRKSTQPSDGVSPSPFKGLERSQ